MLVPAGTQGRPAPDAGFAVAACPLCWCRWRTAYGTCKGTAAPGCVHRTPGWTPGTAPSPRPASCRLARCSGRRPRRCSTRCRPRPAGTRRHSPGRPCGTPSRSVPGRRWISSSGCPSGSQNFHAVTPPLRGGSTTGPSAEIACGAIADTRRNASSMSPTTMARCWNHRSSLRLSSRWAEPVGSKRTSATSSRPRRMTASCMRTPERPSRAASVGSPGQVPTQRNPSPSR